MRFTFVLVIAATVAVLGFFGINAEPMPDPHAEPYPDAAINPKSVQSLLG
uniref:Venom peptide 3 n=1 Tax=Eumenes pomiformis TaxID=693051 RepID=VP3_EUMPO|nr:RecName: Full=Venom peptide 3; Short=EpVP3; Short=VP3; Flags: Precursor [Eumenes pomiformis]ACZ37395.1 VP3 protein precursor [Eumenes pomiformis]